MSPRTARHLRARIQALVASAALLAVAGCGSAEQGAGATPAINDGAAITGDNYEFTVPIDWVSIDASSVDEPIAAGAKDRSDGDGFVDNITVLTTRTTEDLDEIEDSTLEDLRSTMAAQVEVLDRFTIAGEEVARLRSKIKAGQFNAHAEQFFLLRDSILYVVTFTSNKGFGNDKIMARNEEIISTWMWIDPDEK